MVHLPTDVHIAADHYARGFSNLNHETKLRLREAVLYGAQLMTPTTDKRVEASEELTEDHLIPMGVYMNKKKMRDVPAVYLKWLYDNSCNHAGVKKYIIDRFDEIMNEAKKVKR